MRIIKKRGILSLALALALVFSFVPSFSAKAEEDIAYFTTGGIAVLADGTISDDGTHSIFQPDCICSFSSDVTYSSIIVDSGAKTVKFSNFSAPGNYDLLYGGDGWTVIFDGTCKVGFSLEDGTCTINLTAGSTLS